ncbi:MAG: ROK family protein [Propionibacteriaceae bacterium]|nr:ROK family protein [Propionibacteriaceae bacterium]
MTSSLGCNVVGVDLGGTKTAAARVGPDGAVGPLAINPTPAGDGPDTVLDTVAATVLQASQGAMPTAVGIGAAGAIDEHGTVVSSTDTFRGWVGTDIASGLRARLGDLPVRVINDVDAHAVGEAWQGAAAGARSALVVAVGTGVGGALLLDGRLHVGAHHLAGEIGHIPTVGAEDLLCPCGRLGHLEALAAGPAIHRRYRALGGSPEVADTVEVFKAATEGDGIALRVIRAAATGLGRTLAGQITCLDPDVVVISGGLAEAGPLWWEPLEATVRSELVEALAGIPIRPAQLGPVAAILGAARTVAVQ